MNWPRVRQRAGSALRALPAALYVVVAVLGTGLLVGLKLFFMGKAAAMDELEEKAGRQRIDALQGAKSDDEAQRLAMEGIRPRRGRR